MVRFSFCGVELATIGSGALYWPARGALLVADLHLEKGSWYAMGGQMLPPYDSVATLTELAELFAATQASEIWCLGDSFHDRAAVRACPKRRRRGCARSPRRHAGRGSPAITMPG